MESDNLENLSLADKKKRSESPIEMASASEPSGGAVALPSGNFTESEVKNLLAEEEELNQIDQNMSQDDDGSGSSYAAAAKKKKKDFTYALYLHSGTDSRGKLSKNHFVAFEREMLKTRLALSVEENEKTVIEWSTFTGTFGILAAMDKHSAAWCKNLAAGFLYESVSPCRCWSRWERTAGWIYQGFLHGIFWKMEHPTFAMNQILTLNGLKNAKFDHLTWERKCPKGVFISFESKDEKLTDFLEKKKKLNASSCTLRLEKRFRKQRSEQDFLDMLKVKSNGAIKKD